MRHCFLGAAAMGVGITLLISSLRETTSSTRSDQRFRWLSRRALPAAATVVAVNIGYSSIYALLPLYAIASGLDGNLGGSAIGTLSGSFDLGSVVGSMLVGFTVERISYAAGFHLAAGRAVLPRPLPGV